MCERHDKGGGFRESVGWKESFAKNSCTARLKYLVWFDSLNLMSIAGPLFHI